MNDTGLRLYPRQLSRWGTSVLLSVARLSCCHCMSSVSFSSFACLLTPDDTKVDVEEGVRR